MFAITALGSFLLMMNSLPSESTENLNPTMYIRYNKTTGKRIDLDAGLFGRSKQTIVLHYLFSHKL